MLTLIPRFSNTPLPNDLQAIAEYSPTFARVLASRGIQELQQLSINLDRLLPANGLTGLHEAVALLDQAIDNQQKILVVGDFDCDGATSTALMVRVLREMGGLVEFLVPDRFKYGYGLTPEIVDLGMETYQPDLIITVDNGISSHIGVERAKSYGVTVIITDHHLTTKQKPNADAVVNPNQLGCHFASKSLVGVGVAFYVLGNLAKIRRQSGKSSTYVSKYLDLVALGTVADVGILDQNNRILVHHGLNAIRNQQCCVGILALLAQAGRDFQQVNAQDFGFIIAPRINAAGRMDNMRIGIECLLTDDWQTAQNLAYQLDNLNKERRQVEQQMRKQADNVLENLANNHHQQRSITLYQDDWHQGVIGIVAGRLKEKYHLPAIVFAPADKQAVTDDDMIKGSARSIEGVHIRDAIEQVAERYPELISHFGGHAMAGGLTIKKGNFPAFCLALETVMLSFSDDIFAETIYTDGQLQANEFSLDFVDMLTNATIWGHGFLPPMFDGVFVIQDFRLLKEKHLKFWLNYPNVPFSLEAIWFGADFDILNPDNIQRGFSQVHVLFQMEKNVFNGQTKLQLNVKKAMLIETIDS